MEDWVIENGVTDTTYFYLGQIISDVLQTRFAVKQIPKLVKKIGPMLTRLSSILAGASGGGGGMQLAFAGVEGYAASIGITGTAVGSLIGSIGVVGAGVVVAFADVTGIGHDAGKFMEPIQDASKGMGNWTDGIRATQEVVPGTNVPKSFVMEGKYVNGNEVWVHGNATKHMGEYINSAKGSVLVENEMMQSFKSAVDQVLTKPLEPGKKFFVT